MRFSLCGSIVHILCINRWFSFIKPYLFQIQTTPTDQFNIYGVETTTTINENEVKFPKEIEIKMQSAEKK